MNSRDWNILSRNPGIDCGIITCFDNAQIFVGGANKQASELEINSSFHGRSGFGIEIDNHRRECQLAFGIGQRRLRPEIAAHRLGQFQPRFGISAMRALDL